MDVLRLWVLVIPTAVSTSNTNVPSLRSKTCMPFKLICWTTTSESGRYSTWQTFDSLASFANDASIISMLPGKSPGGAFVKGEYTAAGVGGVAVVAVGLVAAGGSNESSVATSGGYNHSSVTLRYSTHWPWYARRERRGREDDDENVFVSSDLGLLSSLCNFEGDSTKERGSELRLLLRDFGRL